MVAARAMASREYPHTGQMVFNALKNRDPLFTEENPMRNATRVAVSVFALTLSLCSFAVAETLPAGLQARYAALISSLNSRDLKAYDKFYTADYISVDPSGKSVKRAEYMAGIADLMKGASKFTSGIKYAGVKSHNGIVEVSFDFTGKIVKPNGTITFHEVGMDSWKKVGKTWMEFKTVDKVMDVKGPK
jgi:hypothetical protein